MTTNPTVNTGRHPYFVPVAHPVTYPVVPESSRRFDKRASSANTRSVQQPIPIPRDYVPISPPSGDERYRGRSSSRPYHVESRLPQTASASRYVPSTKYHYPHSKDYGYDDRYSRPDSDRHRRSSSQQPRGSDLYRPTYSRRRSRSSDFSSFAHSSRRTAPTTGNHDVISQVPAATETMRTIHASSTLPTLVRPSDKQPLIVPINNGRHGWVVVPANGQKFNINPSGSKTIHPLAKPLTSGKQASRLFGDYFGSKHYSTTRSGKAEHWQEDARAPRSMTQAILHPFRRRRDSY